MRLIDADALKAIRFHDLPYSQIVPTDCDTDDKVSAYKSGWNDAIDAIINSAPTVDAVEVVRCKECKHNYHNMIPSGEAEHGCTKCVELPITADFYCAWGER